MYGIYANIGGILMVNVTIYIAYMDPMGYIIPFGICNLGCFVRNSLVCVAPVDISTCHLQHLSQAS